MKFAYKIAFACFAAYAASMVVKTSLGAVQREQAAKTAKIEQAAKKAEKARLAAEQAAAKAEAEAKAKAEAQRPKVGFSATAYMVDAPAETTVGEATVDLAEKTTEWYSEIKSGGYAGYKYYYRCGANGQFSQKSGSSDWKNSSGSKCQISSSENGAPKVFSVVDTGDGYLYQQVKLTGEVKKAEATPVVYNLSETQVIRECKSLLVSSSRFGEVRWDAFGTGDPVWIQSMSTLYLRGKAQNPFGKWVSFKAECSGAGGSVRVVDVN